LRLKDGAHRCEGRVEVKHQGEWGTVYVQYWFLEDANALCRHLEYGLATDAPRGSYFGPRLGIIWYFYLSCNRTEPESTLSINNCVQPDFKNYTHILSHDQDIGVVCSGEMQIRTLTSLHTLLRVICASHWTLANANVVCHQLSCGVAISTPKGAEGNDQLWKAQYHCLGNESFLWEYAVTALGGPDCSHGNMASVIC
ncbi:hypothetical protein M91_00205, partial [Bos mutus]